MTSTAEFPEEEKVPPIVLDTPALPIGSIITFDATKENMLSLSFAVSDANVDDELQVQPELSVAGQQTSSDLICSVPTILPNGEPRREFRMFIAASTIKKGACSKLMVNVSSNFLEPCPTTDVTRFGEPADRNDVGRAIFWIWEMSDDPAVNRDASQAIVTSCETVTPTAQTPMPMTMVP